ncbi:MAG: hypothetical protein ACYS21_19105, partial [Planctomycetota bacterium]
YVGKGKKTTDRPRQTAIAYDQKIIAQIGHTNVLLRDGRVLFFNPEQLERFGVTAQKPDAEIRGAWGEAEVEAVSSPQPRFAATLSNGVTVELVGLYHGETIKDLVFWKPDGSSFSDSETQKYRERVVLPKWGNKDFRFEYGLMMRFSPLDELSVECGGVREAGPKDELSVSKVGRDSNRLGGVVPARAGKGVFKGGPYQGGCCVR